MKLIILSALLAWFIAQASKSISSKTKKSFFRCGGMPSAHSAFTSALTTAVGITQGFSSALFAVTLGFSIIVWHDAIRVRKHHTLKQVIVGVLIGIAVTLLINAILF
jgi:acid phosphatase family membrane protein YuiD